MKPPPAVECGHCGQLAYVGKTGIRCYCTPSLSAVEHHARRRWDDASQLAHELAADRAADHATAWEAGQ